MNTIIAKGRDGFEGRTDIELGGGRMLLIRTNKARNGALASTAQVCKKDGSFIRFDLVGDFSKTLIQTAKRCTERAVVMQHTLAEDHAAKLRPEIERFYAAKKPAAALN